MTQLVTYNEDAPGWRWDPGRWEGVERDRRGRIITPFHHLERRAESIAGGLLARERTLLENGNDYHALHMAMKTFPGHLDLKAEMWGNFLRWSLSAREAGDLDAYASCAGFSGPDACLAWYIESAEQHHREQLLLIRPFEQVGGLA